MSILTGKTVAVTGVMGALGHAVMTEAADQGAVVIGIDVLSPEQMSAPIPEQLSDYLQLDLLDSKQTHTAFATLQQLDSLLNIAGGFAMGAAAHELYSDQWTRMFELNVLTLRHAVAAALPLLKSAHHASVVNVGALGAQSGLAYMSAYGCSKSAVMRLTESLSEELKGEGVNVNAVLPSVIDTPANRQAMPDANFDAWVSPAKLAKVICFLASEDASAIHGALLPVKGLV